MSSIRRPMFSTGLLMQVALALCAATVWGQSTANKPQIGYLYPGGGQQGSVIEIIAGGQFLRGASKVYVSAISSGEIENLLLMRYMNLLKLEASG